LLRQAAILPGLAVLWGCLGGQYNSSAANPVSPIALKESVTWKDTTHHYDPAVLKRGTPRSRVLEAFGPPNEEYQQNGALEDVFAFYPDGAKFVNPTLRPRNIALGMLTFGGATAARAGRQVYVERGLTRYYVYYDKDQTLTYVVRKEPAAQGGATSTPAAPADTTVPGGASAPLPPPQK
jgi:hypothetical protein